MVIVRKAKAAATARPELRQLVLRIFLVFRRWRFEARD
jgi:hypothetical protein